MSDKTEDVLFALKGDPVRFRLRPAKPSCRTEWDYLFSTREDALNHVLNRIYINDIDDHGDEREKWGRRVYFVLRRESPMALRMYAVCAHGPERRCDGPVRVTVIPVKED